MSVIHGGRQMVIPDMGLRVRAPRSAAAPWWQVAGKICVAAYQPKGAADLAASYVNLANPGTYNAAPGVAPSFSTATGWTFNGSTQYLNTSVVAAAGYSMLVRFSGNTAVNAVLAGSADASADRNFALWADVGASVRRYNAGGQYQKSPPIAAGVMAVAGQYGYLNGSVDTPAIATWAGVTTQAIFIGARNNAGGGPAYPTNATIACLVIYAETLTAPQVATVSAAMAAL